MAIKKLKLVELTKQNWPVRWQALTEFCKIELGLELTAEIRQCTDENFKNQLKDVLSSQTDICVIDEDYSVEVLCHISQVTAESIQLGAVDILIRDETGWWPRPCLEAAMIKTISQKVGLISFDSHALIGGVNGFAKMAVGALAKMGFLNINIVEKSEELGAALIKEVKKKYFQVNFSFIGFDEVTKLPGIHLLLMNTIPLTFENEILDELYFFNFLDRKGVVMDLTMPPANTPLVLEAEQWGARRLSGDYFWCERDALMIQKATGLKINSEAYRTLLRSIVDAAPFEPAAYLKRFRERGQ
jgi:shikimate 5-dehydrogenase